MKKLIPIIALFGLLTAHANAEKTSKISNDPFDLSASQKQVKELGVITQAEVNNLETKAKELYRVGNCKDAQPILEEFARKANWLANMISATLDPYYGASYDDRKDYPFSKVKPLIPLETLSNDYKQKRNIAFAMQGDCFVQTGDYERAIPMLLKALDLIDIENEVWWEKTRNNLLKIIGVKF